MTNRKVYYNIADYIILIYSKHSGPEIDTDDVYRSWQTLPSLSVDLSIEVLHEKARKTDTGKIIFYAPFFNINDRSISCNKYFWAIYQFGKYYYLKTFLSDNMYLPEILLRFQPDNIHWQLIVPANQKIINPFQYPVGSIIIYYLTQLYGSVILHASGINYKNRGYIFSGFSGSGKSTIAGLYNNTGAHILNDDRIILRKIDGKSYIYNTPVYKNDSQKRSLLTEIFLINHNRSNKIHKLCFTEAVARLMAFTIQHHYLSALIKNQIRTIGKIISSTPVFKLGFSPEKSIINFISSNITDV